jgi:hypothetical protein
LAREGSKELGRPDHGRDEIEQMKPTELFYDPMGYSWLQGQNVDWTPGDHHDHVHVAF